ncbi:hypothetical protein HDA35_005841 [Micromonospora purpureochromogenes]|uniref:Uncharacterized protein n=1 Tax=Micromonospora purpureochromogenes TaxID=47872 RepID=A0ABX2RVG3_9ACTN|nr:hypothetical protein [Micromonospora purpureochromogenes]
MAPEQEALQRLRDGLVRVHERAVVHDHECLHIAAHDISQAVCEWGHPCPEGPEFRTCPVCQFLPGQRCINVPGHTLQDHYHPERCPQT